jgi:protein BCP1
MPRPPSKRVKRAEPSSDEVEDRGSSGSEEESFSTSGSDSDDGEESSEEVTAYLELVAFLSPGILCPPSIS